MITLNNVTFAYSKKKEVFSNLNLTLQPGSIYGLLGKNGAGKTTLLKMMCGLATPSSGSCTTLGEKAASKNPSLMRELFFLPEEFYMSDMRISKFVSLNAPFYPEFDIKQFHRYLAEFEISPDNSLRSLSYGEKKKVMIGFGIATNTRLLLFDEPTNGLDIPSKRLFRRIMASIANENRCIIISTHQVRDLESLIDHLLIVHNNRILLDENVESITQKLCFKTVQTVSNDKEIIYSESSLKGHNILLNNVNSEDSQLDMELLFNGVQHCPEKINQIFNLN
ncbi:MAG: transporter related [Bacteroidetes bacterium]|nr:transporter related [Bacteroidota bacterium]